MMLVYVDDILITSNSPSSIADLIANLNFKFPLKDLGITFWEFKQPCNPTLSI